MSGGDLTLGMADDRVRVNPEGVPEPGEGDHHREQHGLDDVHAVQGRRVRPAAQHVVQRPFDVWCQGFGAGAEVSGENGGCLEQAQGHTAPLRALAGEDEHDTPGVPGDSAHQAGRRLPTAQRREPGQ